MAKSALQNIEIWSGLQSAGGQRRLLVSQAANRRHSESIDGDEGCSFTIPLGSDAHLELVERCIIRYQFAPLTPGSVGDFLEYLFTEMESVHAADGNVVQVVGRSLSLLLTDSGLVYRQTAGARKEYSFSDVLTPSDWITDFILPAMARRGYTSISLGNVDFTNHVPLTVDWSNAMELAQQLKGATQGEFRLRQNGTLGYLFDLVTGINAGATPIYLREGRSLAAMKVKSNAIPMATFVTPKGTLGSTDLAKSVAHVRWEITAIDTANLDITVAPIDAGTARCVHFDTQYSILSGLPTGWYILRLATGRLIPITNSFAATQKLRLSDLSTLVVGEFLELREDIGTTVHVDASTPAFPVQTGAPAGLNLTLTNPFSGVDPVPTDDLHVDWMARPSAQQLSTASSAVADVAGSTTFEQDVTLTTTAGVAVGDWGFLHTNVGTPWALFGKVFTVTQVISGTVIRVVPRYSWHLAACFTAGALVKQCKVYRAKAATRVTDEVAATNVVTVASAATVANNDLIEFYVETGGVPPAALPAGAAIATYGMVEKPYIRQDLRGECNLAHDVNPFLDAYAGATNAAPDGWTSNDATKCQRRTNTIGPGTLYMVELTTAVTGFNRLSSGLMYYRPVAGNEDVSLRLRLKIGDATHWNGTYDHQVRIGLGDASGTAFIGTSAILYAPTPASGVPVAAGAVASQVDPATTIDVDVRLIDLLRGQNADTYNPGQNGFTVLVELRTFNVAFVAMANVGGCTVVQDEALPEEGTHIRYDGAQLHDEALTKLERSDAPLATYEASIVDWSRLSSSDADLEILVGAPVYADDQTLLMGSAAPLLRVQKIDYDDDEPGRTLVTIDNLPDALTTLVASL